MSNNDVLPLMQTQILPAIIRRLRGQLSMPQLIHNNVEDAAAKKGERIEIPAPVYFKEGAKNFDTVNGSSSTGLVVESVGIDLVDQPTLQWDMTDREFMSHASDHTLPSAMEGAVDGIAEYINEACFNLYKQVPLYSGKLGTGDDKTKADLIQLRGALQKQKVRKGRNVVLSDDTEGQFLDIFSNISESGDQNAVIEGMIGRKYGFDIFSDIQTPTHVPGNASENTGLTLASNTVEGSKVLEVSNFDNANPTLVEGDIVILVDGSSYTVAEDAGDENTPNVSLVVKTHQEVKAHVAGDSVSVPMGSAHGVDLGFHPTFAAIAFRKLQPAGNAPGVTIAEMSDPVTGIPLRLMTWYDATLEKTFWKLSTLFGTTVVDATRAVRMGESNSGM